MPAVDGKARHFWGPQNPSGLHPQEATLWDGMQGVCSKPQSSAPSLTLLLSEVVKGLEFWTFPEFSRLLWVYAAPWGAAASWGCSPASQPAASCHLLSQSLDRESSLSIWDAMRPSFLVYSSWQAKLCHAWPGLGAFPLQWHRETSGGRSCQYPPLQSPLGPRCQGAAPLCFFMSWSQTLVFFSLGLLSWQCAAYLLAA